MQKGTELKGHNYYDCSISCRMSVHYMHKDIFCTFLDIYTSKAAKSQKNNFVVLSKKPELLF